MASRTDERVGAGIFTLYSVPFLLGGAWWAAVVFLALAAFMLLGPEDARP